MAKFNDKYRIESNRLQNWDYSTSGDYYITINTKNRRRIFGTIKDGEMILSEYGKIVKTEFLKINQYHKRAKLDEFIIMPDHVHCIITLMNNNDGSLSSPVIKQNRKLSIDELKEYRKLRRNMVLIKILGKFKHQTSKQINILRNTPGTKNWQSDFYDHVIRDGRAYQNIKNYIITNPQNWHIKNN